jgi:micrococcal nuclease
MRVILLLLLVTLVADVAAARSFAVTISRVKDGDTVELLRPRPFGKPVSIRLLASHSGIDTPETDGPCEAEREAAAKAKAFTVGKVTAAQNRARAVNVRTDKYGGRYDAQLIVIVDGVKMNLGDELLKAGLALPYDGGTRPDWCAVLAARDGKPENILPPDFDRR